MKLFLVKFAVENPKRRYKIQHGYPLNDYKTLVFDDAGANVCFHLDRKGSV